MTIDDLVQDVAADVTEEEPAKISPILFWVISQVIVMAIRWFLDRYTGQPEKATEEFMKFFKNMGMWNRIRWSMKVKQVTKHYNTIKSGEDIAVFSAGRFAKLDDEAVKKLFEEQKNS